MPLNLLFITSHFAIDPENISGGIGYRYVGLYGSMIRTLLKVSPDSKIFWYSQNDHTLRAVTQGGTYGKRQNMLSAILFCISATVETNSLLIVILAFPYAVPSFQSILAYLLSLLTLKVHHLIVDDFDPPVELSHAFGTDRVMHTFYSRLIELLTLKTSKLALAVSDSYKRHLARLYRMNKDKISIVPNGFLLKHHFMQKTISNPFVLLYSGSAVKGKDIDKLLTAVRDLRERGNQIELYIAGMDLIGLPDWVHSGSYSWPSFVRNVLSKADVGVIPYPSSRLHFCYAFPAKVADYMAAGKPIVTTNLKETANIVRKFDCGLVAKDWQEFEHHIETLCRDRQLARKLGLNGRMAAEKHLNYETLANNLLSQLSNVR